ncbi:MAG: hypothetical protein R3B70_22125 [Polyangiaceae bacterium]
MVTGKKKRAAAGGGELFAATKKKRVPFDFVLDELAEMEPETRPMFGSIAVYVEDKIVFVLRERESAPHDNGVWVATTREHHASLRGELPNLRSISVLGDGGVTGWQMLAADAEDFEEAVRRACSMVLRGDPRVGKVPASRRRR